MSSDQGDERERKKEFQRALQSRMTPNLRRTLGAFDIIMVLTVLVDLVFMMGFIGDALVQPLVVINLVTVAIGYISMTTKRRIGKQVSKELRRNEEDLDSEGVEIEVDDASGEGHET
ncbi:hypothetical protein E2P65_05015 [Candidatus Bathyarchaeota archaeon]|nr:hypothetical protein E2P65_05015 [Candidatus Bathyarchaeota archaeon]